MQALSHTGRRKPLQRAICVGAPSVAQDTPARGSALPAGSLCQCSRQVASTASEKWGGGGVRVPGTCAVTGGGRGGASSVPRTGGPGEPDSQRTALGAAAFLFIVPSWAPPLGTSHGQVRPNWPPSVPAARRPGVTAGSAARLVSAEPPCFRRFLGRGPCGERRAMACVLARKGALPRRPGSCPCSSEVWVSRRRPRAVLGQAGDLL